MTTEAELRDIYARRFKGRVEYRNRVWSDALIPFLKRYIGNAGSILDLGCGYGEFINNVSVPRRLAMDLNPDTAAILDKDVHFCSQDCSAPWGVETESLDVVFTSNFFEHLETKGALGRTLVEAHRALKPKGRLIAMGPNIRYLPGSYWDFFDHHVALTERSLVEILEIQGFKIEKVIPRFLPYTMVNAPEYPPAFIRLYLAMPMFWRFLGRQFLVVASK